MASLAHLLSSSYLRRKTSADLLLLESRSRHVPGVRDARSGISSVKGFAPRPFLVSGKQSPLHLQSSFWCGNSVPFLCAKRENRPPSTQLIRTITNATRASMSPATTALQEMSNDGAFRRSASTFRNFISRDKSSEFPAAAGRYHLYISYACPWASRCYAFIKLKGLEDTIGVTVTKPKWERTKEGEDHFGWVFPSTENEEPGAQVDPINGAKSIREIYELADPGFSGKYSVPVLWDKEKKTIVNNESSEIVQMFNNEFVEFAKNPNCDLIPDHFKSKIKEVDEFIYDSINNGVYRCGFAKQQKPYDEAVVELFNALDRCENILSAQRYLCGPVLTEADIRLFVTLIRFDEVYVVHFKCNKKLIREYPSLFNYTKDIYQITGIADTVNMCHIKKHYYGSHPSINPFGVIPVGPGTDFNAPHDRYKFQARYDAEDHLQKG